MNLTLGICWIEDQASEAEVEAVENAVRASGFEPEIQPIRTGPEIEEFARQQAHFQDFDLILLDLKLGGRMSGDDLALEIRRSFRFTPILFYSAVPEESLRKMMADKRVEGAYCAHRASLPQRVGELVSDLSPALNDLSGMRGLAARVVAECDQEFRAILRHLATTLSEDALIEGLKSRYEKDSQEWLAEINSTTDLAGLIDHRGISSNLLFRAVYSHLDQLDLSDAIRDKRRSIRKYPELVLSRRNILSHGLEERSPEGWRIVRRGSGGDLTAEDFRTFRTDFLAHLHHLRELRELLIDQKTD